MRLTLWEFNLEILHCINDWNDGYQLYHSSRFFSFLLFLHLLLVQITQGNLRFFSFFYATKRMMMKKILHIGTTGYMLVLKNHKICLNRHERIFYSFFFFFYFLRICIKKTLLHMKEKLFLLVFFFASNVHTKKNERIQLQYFFLLILLLFFYSCDFYPLRFKKLKFSFLFLKNKENGIRLMSN